MAEQVPIDVLLAFLERAQQQLFLPRAHPLERSQASRARRGFEVVDRGNAKLAVEQRDGLGTDTLQTHQLEERRRKLREQLLVNGAGAGGCDLANARRQVLADPRPRAQLRFIARGRRFRLMRDDVGAVAIRANLERVLALELEQIADFAEHAGDGDVV